MLAPELEAMPRDELVARQGERLVHQVRYVYANSRFFRERLDAAGAHPADVRGVADLEHLPTFEKDDLRHDRARTGDPFSGTLCVPVSELAFVTRSTGTSGVPSLFGLCPDEHDRAGELFARSMFAVGLRPGDTVVFPPAPNLGVTIGWNRGAERLGVVKLYFGGSAADVVEQTFTLGRGIDITVPFVYDAEADAAAIARLGVEPREVFPNLRFVWSGVDASDERRRLVLDTWGVPLRNQYGSGDQFLIAPECPADAHWFHLPDDAFVFEVLDPETGRPVPSGGTGLLHLTNLWMRSFPYLRFCLDDMVTHDTSPCPCGRTTTRIRIRGRMAWAVRVGTAYVFSQEVEGVLWSRPGLAGCDYQLVRVAAGDRLVVRVGVERAARPPGLADELQAALGAAFGTLAEVRLVEPADFPDRAGGKAKRVTEE